MATDSASHDIVEMVYCRLLKYDKDLKITTDLAERYEVLDGGLRIRFTLKANAVWHDGKPVTAADVLYTYQVMRDPATPTPYRSNFDLVDRAEMIDARTIDFVYREPYAPALESFTGALTVVPKHLLQGQDLLTSPLNRQPVGCGPYRFVRWEAQREIELAANPTWYEQPPYITRYLYRIIPDQATMFLELLNQSLDTMGLTPQQYARQTDNARFQDSFLKFKYTGFNYTYLGFNLRDPRFQDVRVRRALAHAVNKQELIEGVLFGLGQPATGPYRPGTWVYNGNVSSPEFDVARAAALLDEAGWRDRDGDGVRDRDGKPLQFTILTNQGNEQRKLTGEILQRRFRDVGVAVELRIIEWSAFLNEFVDTGKFDAVILGWNTGIDPDQYDIWHSSKTGQREFNFVHYRNAQVDQLLDAGRKTFDEAQRRAAYARIQEILAWEQPYVFLYVPESLPAVHRRVRGVELAAAGIGWNFERWWIPAGAQALHAPAP